LAADPVANQAYGAEAHHPPADVRRSHACHTLQDACEVGVGNEHGAEDDDRRYNVGQK
jgi:hypothetical protein